MKDSIFVNGLDYFLISSIVTVILAAAVTALVHRLIERFNRRYQDKAITNQYLYQTVRAGIWLIACLVIIRQIEPLSSLGNTIMGATSILAVAAGIAAQATFGNYIAGFFLAVHQPFRVGDIIFIKERGISGTVKEITFRHTVLLTQEQTEIIIPNTVMNSAVIEDMSNGTYSEMIELKVDGDTDLKKLQQIIDRLLKKQEDVLKDRDSTLIIRSLDSSGYHVAFPVCTASLKDFGKVRNSLLPELNKALKANKIKLK